MSHQISSPCSEWAAAFDRSSDLLQYVCCVKYFLYICLFVTLISQMVVVFPLRNQKSQLKNSDIWRICASNIQKPCSMNFKDNSDPTISGTVTRQLWFQVRLLGSLCFQVRLLGNLGFDRCSALFRTMLAYQTVMIWMPTFTVSWYL
jgi:hypothetical protein